MDILSLTRHSIITFKKPEGKLKFVKKMVHYIIIFCIAHPCEEEEWAVASSAILDCWIFLDNRTLHIDGHDIKNNGTDSDISFLTKNGGKLQDTLFMLRSRLTFQKPAQLSPEAARRPHFPTSSLKKIIFYNGKII